MVDRPFGGPWTRDKLEILSRYLDSYTTVLKAQPFNLIYVDSFAGEGSWNPGSGYISDDYGDFNDLHRASPRIALQVQDKPFDRLLFIEKDPQSSESLQRLRSEFPSRNIAIVNGDANTELPNFCHDLQNFDRAVVFLDPFATEVEWDTVEAIAKTQKIDCWILFPLMAITRMMPTGNEPSPVLQDRLDRIFGGREYWQSLYEPSLQLSFFDEEPKQERQHGSEGIAVRYAERLESVFAEVAPTRRTFRNSKNAPMFALFFAASNPNGACRAIPIANHILNNW